MTTLKIEAVTKKFGGLTAVSGVSFDVEDGEIVGLLGPNGSGKTTLINMISGALPLTSGKISLGDVDISGKRPDQISKAKVARTFQLVRILPSVTLKENVMLSAAFGETPLWGPAAEEVTLDALDRVGLSGRAELPAGALTYIDQKRLELARAFAGSPKLLLLDEWLAGLNPSELEEGLDLIRSLKSAGMTILLVEHIMTAVRALCPRVVVMNSGELIADDATEAALNDPSVIEAYLGTQKYA